MKCKPLVSRDETVFPQLHDTIETECFIGELQVFDTTKGWLFQAKRGISRFYSLSEYYGYPVLSLSDAFRGYEYETIDVSGMNVSNVIIANNLFKNADNLKAISLAGWDTSNIISMRQAFSKCMHLEEINFGGIDLGRVKVFSSMFKDCIRLKEVNFKGVNLHSIVNTDCLFIGCNSLEKVYIEFDRTSREIRYEYILDGCDSIKELEILGTHMKDLHSSNRIDLIDNIYSIPTIMTDDEYLARAISGNLSKRAVVKTSRERLNRSNIDKKLSLMGLDKVCILFTD